MNIVFFGTSNVGLPILEALQGQHTIVHIVTSPDSKVGRKQILTPTAIAQFAIANNIPTSKPEKVKNNETFLEFLRTLQADIFIVVSYGKILPENLLNIPPLQTINVHFSLLPKYRGPAPIQFALLNGEQTTGTTIFILDALVDHGPTLALQSVDVGPDDTFTSLASKLSDISAELLLNVLPKYQSAKITPQKQNHHEASVTHMIKKEHGKADWHSKTAQEIYNQFRAFNVWPGLWTEYQGDVLKILQCRVYYKELEDADLPKDVIPCKDDTYLQLLEVQLAGKNKMAMKDFLNGHSDFYTVTFGTQK